MKYDVVVVGAGPAGSTAAKFLAEKGVKVLLIDKSKFPRDKPCGGGLPLRVLNRFQYVKNENFIESYSYGGLMYSASLKYKAKVQKSEPVGAMILRRKFDFALVKLAIDRGVVFSEGKAAKDIKILKDKVKIVLDDGSSIDSQVVIGADGVWSLVAKKSGLHQRRNMVDMCVFQEYKVDKETLDRFFGEARFCYIHARFQGIAGYGWVFPKKEHLNIGVFIKKEYSNIGIGENGPEMGKSKMKTNLLEIYKNYIKTLKKNRMIPEDLEMRRYEGGALPVAPLEKTYTDRVLLCGDAGGFINPISGDGIYYAMSSGEIAAGVITEALETGNTGEKFLSKYQVNWKKDFGKDIEILLRSTKNFREQTEKFLKLASRDKKLADITLGMLHGRLSIREYRWKLIGRYLYVYFKDLFGLYGS